MLELVAARRSAEIDRELEIDHEALADLLFVRHHAVIGMDDQPVDEDRVAHALLLIAAMTAHRLDRSAHIMGADERGAVFDRQEMGGERAAEPLLGSAGATEWMKRLREAPTSSGRPNFAERVETRDACDALLRRLAEADAGIEHDGVAANAGARRRSPASARRRHRCRRECRSPGRRRRGCA